MRKNTALVLKLCLPFILQPIAVSLGGKVEQGSGAEGERVLWGAMRHQISLHFDLNLLGKVP